MKPELSCTEATTTKTTFMIEINNLKIVLRLTYSMMIMSKFGSLTNRIKLLITRNMSAISNHNNNLRLNLDNSTK